MSAAVPTSKTFDLRGVIVRANDLVDGVFLDPELPPDFDDTDNKLRPHEQAIWWGVPFIRTEQKVGGGVRYDLRCLDGGAWDRSTWWGSFDTPQLAAAAAKTKPTYAIHPVEVFG
jgi:hypothetical protein